MNNCNTIEGNWLETMKNKLACGVNQFSIEMLRSATIGLKIEKLLCDCPEILAEDTEASCNIESTETLTRILNKVKCGQALSENEIQWSEAMIALKSIECCELQYGSPA